MQMNSSNREPTCRLTIDETAELFTILYRHTYIPPEMEHANSAYQKIFNFLEDLAQNEVINGDRNSGK